MEPRRAARGRRRAPKRRRRTRWREPGKARSPGECRPYSRAEILAAAWRSSSSPISRTTWSTLVEPAVPNGMPAISTSGRRPWRCWWRSAMRLPFSTISSKLDTSREWTGVHAPQQAHPPRRVQRRAHRQQRHRRTLAGDPPRGRARARVADHRRRRDRARDLPRRAGERVGGGRLEPRLGEMDSRLDRLGRARRWWRCGPSSPPPRTDIGRPRFRPTASPRRRRRRSRSRHR